MAASGGNGPDTSSVRGPAPASAAEASASGSTRRPRNSRTRSRSASSSTTNRERPGSSSAETTAPFLKTPGDSMKLLREKAQHLEQQAEQLRKLAQAVHQEGVLGEISKVTAHEESKLDLLRGALLIARLDNEDLDIEPYLRE